MLHTRVRDAAADGEEETFLPSNKQRITNRSVWALQLLLFIGAVTFFVMLYRSFAFGTAVGCVGGAVVSSSPLRTSSIPQYLQTSPELFPG